MLSTNLNASSYRKPWSNWGFEIHSVGCALEKYHTFSNSADKDKRGFLSNSAFNQASVRFFADTNPYNDRTSPDKVGKIKFALQISPEHHEISDNEKIASANISGFLIIPRVGEGTNSHMFTLEPPQSEELFKKFTENEDLEIILNFRNGSNSSSRIYAASLRRNQVWAEMFKTCIDTHKQK